MPFRSERSHLVPPRRAALRRVIGLVFGAIVVATAVNGPVRAAEPGKIRVVALGDSLTAGYGLPKGQGFAPRLEAALTAAGHHVEVIDAGVSGDTTDAGLARLDWSVPADAQAVIVELGANDALRGLPPAETRKNLDAIVARLTARGQKVLVAGMLAPRNLGETYAKAFDPIFAEVAQAHGALFYPFFLDGVALEANLVQPDGLHPTAEGVEVIVTRILPSVRDLLARVGSTRP
ncbi:arylesterase [Pinisolibacter sp.]|uniref:arylesterase n=1 Tax=Pinisolibacter sp. TaxID=2172024 RepID=UPI002FDC879B